MSEESVEAVRAAVAATRTGGREVAMALMHPEVEFTSRITSVEGTAYRGLEGAGRYYDDMADAFAEWHNDITRIEAVAEDAVLAEVVFRGTSRSGAPVELPSVVVFRVADGKIRRIDAHPDRKAALASLEPSG